ncbi:hypothetical protein DCAR_0416247 [Daucus carota subsp. sativus]|uniref:CP12 domain-containing protein n=1 Tax=Daucus carota subsp. sativus TaxID=79200 RepID=A0AAF0WWL6_DAUCS|nr:PREDICTED: calvin cycle protein CP12-3, chloroplastic-like [Daucus carota subsp. sativus]WOG96909.1 hypothetical protein DCAR_0416247 [Daucus carota subsp. sativus]
MSSISGLKVNINPLRNEVRGKRRTDQVAVKWRVRAMGGETGAKYRGTQMREKKLTEMIESKVMEAKEACDGDHDGSDECKVAWDEVEEVSQAKAHLRSKLERQEDPLESYCDGNPETDECVVFDD